MAGAQAGLGWSGADPVDARESAAGHDAALERDRTLERAGWIGLFALGPAALVYLSFNAGGYFPSATGFAALLLLQALILRTTLADRPFEGFSRPLALVLGALSLYGAWQLTSLLWSHASARALDSFDRTLLYVLALALFGSIRYPRAHLRWAIRALVAAIAAVCLIGLLSRLLPHVWPTSVGFASDRLDYPLTYWNAEGMLAAVALILAFHLTAERASHWSIRVLAAALMPALALTLLLTFSRGALGVGVIGLVIYCLLARLHTLPAAILAVVPAGAVAVRSGWDATLLATDRAGGPAALAQGRHVAVVLGVCMLAAALSRAALLALDRRMADLAIVRRPPRPAIRAAIATTLALAALLLAIALGGIGVVHREYDSFAHKNTDAPAAHVRDRLSEVNNNGRLSLWRVAVRVYEGQPIHGTGAGTYQLYYPRVRTEGLYVVDAHSLYLQSLAELGLVGLALILLAVLGMLGALASRIRGPDRGLYAALLAVGIAWALHQAFDWDWQMPAVTLVVFVLAGMALARPVGGGAGLRGLPAPRTFVALGWLALAVAPLLVGLSYARLHTAAQEMRTGDCAAARSSALASISLSARRPQAYEVLGVCDLEQGFPAAALPAMSQAASLEPVSWEAQFWLAVARAASGLDPRAAIARARSLNPLEGGLANAQRRLDTSNPRVWERVAPRLRSEALTSGRLALTSL
jgi:O-antigen ligase